MYIAMPLGRNFLFFVGVARLQTKRSSSYAKHAIGLKLEGSVELIKSQLTKIS